MTVIKAAVAQACAVQYDTQATLEKMKRLATEAKEGGAELVVFPEAFLGGYPKGRTFGCVVGERDASGREDFLAYHRSAIDLQGPVVRQVEKLAADIQIFIVSGVIERDGGTLYCSVIWVDHERGLLDKRRKLMPTASERLIWGQGTAEDVKLATARLGDVDVKISATICWENYMPLLRMRNYELGAQLYCAPTVDARPVWEKSMVHIALEGRCFVLSACQFSQEKDHVPHEGQGKATNDEDVKIAGGSMIVDPLGNILAGPLRGKEGVLVADLDLDTIIRGKFDLDITGHYARPDIFKLVTTPP